MHNVKILAHVATMIASKSEKLYDDGLVTIRVLDNGKLHIQDDTTGKQWTKDIDTDTSKLSQECLDDLEIKYLSILGVSAEHIELCAASLLKIGSFPGQEAEALRHVRNMIIEHRALNLAPRQKKIS